MKNKRLIQEFLRDLDFIETTRKKDHVFERITMIQEKWKEKLEKE